MLTRKRLVLAIAVVIIIPVVAIAWWLLSPLFISKTVEEEFPFAVSATVPIDMTRSEVEEVMASMAKIDVEVTESMPDMTMTQGGGDEAPTAAIETPTPVPTATAMPSPTPESLLASQQTESDIENFVLEDLTVEVGTTIVWTNQDGTTHTVTSGVPASVTDQWDSGALPQGESFSFSFDEAGEFPYFCKIHPSSMQAIVRVEEKSEPASTSTQAATPTPVPTPTPEPTATPMPTPIPEPTATPAPAGPVKLKDGDFRDFDNFHQGSGQATIYQGPDGSLLLRLENFNVTNGPDLHVILSPHPNPGSQTDLKAPGYIDLGKIKGNKGNQNYTIAADVDISSMQSIVIYCKPFHVIFSVASLQDAR